MDPLLKYAYYLKHPRDQDFYKRFAYLMTIFDLGDQQWWGYPNPGKIIYLIKRSIIPVMTVFLVAQLVYLYQNAGRVPSSVLNTMLVIVPVNILVLMLIDAERKVRFLTGTLIFLSISAIIMWQVIPLHRNHIFREEIKNKTMILQTSLYTYLPFDYSYDYRIWAIVHIFNIVPLIIGALLVTLMEIIFFLIIFHLLCHLEIFSRKICLELLGDFDHSDVTRRITTLLEYHVFIIQNFGDSEAGLGLNISVNYLYNLCVDSFMMLMFMSGDGHDKAIYGCHFIISVGVLLVVSYYLEKLHTVSDHIPNLVYSVPWEDWTLSNQKSVLMILRQSHHVLAFKGAGGVVTGVKPMLSIIKTVCSYYLYMKSTM